MVKTKSTITTFKWLDRERENDMGQYNKKKNSNGMANINFHPNEICSINP